jgi:hypothetical protein
MEINWAEAPTTGSCSSSSSPPRWRRRGPQPGHELAEAGVIDLKDYISDYFDFEDILKPLRSWRKSRSPRVHHPV